MYKDGDQMREELAAELDEHDDDDELSKLREVRLVWETAEGVAIRRHACGDTPALMHF